MKAINKKWGIIEIPHDTINGFKNLCPECGNTLKLKKIKKGRPPYRRSVKSKVCGGCGYAEYISGDREDAILKGYLDDEI